MSNPEFKAMVRIAGADCDGNLSLMQGLNRVEGVGLNFARAVATVLGISPWMRVGNLTDEQVTKIEEALKDPMKYGIPVWMLNRRFDPMTGQDLHLVGSDVQFNARLDVEQQKRVRSWKGVRHSLGLKVRGQRTRTTGRTGRTIGVSKKALQEKASKPEEGS